MAARPQLLVAVTPMGYVHARRALHHRFDLISAFSMQQARIALKAEGLAAILCSIHFDDSRMFDLLREAQVVAPHIPFICCRILHSPLSGQAMDALLTSARLLGCRDFVDFNALQRNHDLDEADRRFCETVLELLAPPAEKRNASTG
ncbi:MAG TPA: hypothetical protein VE325_07545 [Burkholderiales bacterium]|nr:hypothetical protein [Burkholderiales bacterium]